MEHFLVITDEENGPSHTSLADSFRLAAHSAGYALTMFDTKFSFEHVFPDGGSAPAEYRGPDGIVPGMGDGGAVLFVAEPSYWFDLSRTQKNRLDHFYHYLMPSREKDDVAECTLVFCSKRTERTGLEHFFEIYDRFCLKNGLRNKGVILAASIDLLP